MKNAFFLLCLFGSLKLAAQSNIGCFTTSGQHTESATTMVVTHDGNYVIAGSTLPSAGPADWMLVKTEPSGNILWSKLLGGDGSDFCIDIIETSDHSLVAVGESDNLLALKFDENGNLQWAKDIDLLGGEVVGGVAESDNDGFVITGYAQSSSVSVFPNPSSLGIFEIKLSQPNSVVKVYDLFGRIVLNEKISSGLFTIDLSSQTSGTYFLEIKNGNETAAQKLLIE